MSTRELFDLSGTVSLVTGAGWGGLGSHSARALGEMGSEVWVTDHPNRREDLDQTVAELHARGIAAHAAAADVCDETSVDLMIAEIETAGRGLHVVAHHAGVNMRARSWDTSLADWQKVIDINVTGTWLVVRRASQAMARSGGGKIITLGSIYANIVGPIPEPAYYASKGAVSNLTRGLAMELASSDITVNCVAPGTFFPTNMTAPLADDNDRLEEMAKRTMLGRLGDPSRDLGGVIGFLASRASDYMTGQTIYVDGGWTAW